MWLNLIYPFWCAIYCALLSYLINLRFSSYHFFSLHFILRIYLIILTQPASNSLCYLRVVYEFIFGAKEFEIKVLLLLFKSTYTDPDPYMESLMSFFNRGGGVAVWLERWTCNLEAPRSSPVLTASWISSR